MVCIDPVLVAGGAHFAAPSQQANPTSRALLRWASPARGAMAWAPTTKTGHVGDTTGKTSQSLAQRHNSPAPRCRQA